MFHVSEPGFEPWTFSSLGTCRPTAPRGALVAIVRITPQRLRKCTGDRGGILIIIEDRPGHSLQVKFEQRLHMEKEKSAEKMCHLVLKSGTTLGFQNPTYWAFK